ncbi:MAG: hypothetical protein ISP56_04175 [Flavobacteriaceae bacterium]|nr:hypothetical protein [Flavobacteriaceae bacterium]
MSVLTLSCSDSSSIKETIKTSSEIKCCENCNLNLIKTKNFKCDNYIKTYENFIVSDSTNQNGRYCIDKNSLILKSVLK